MSACNSKAPGVVCVATETSSPSSTKIVPNKPARNHTFFIIECAINAVVVFPFVPVIPITLSLDDGLSFHAQANSATAVRASGTCTQHRESSQPLSGATSETIAIAPFSKASPINFCPSTSLPRTATKTDPGITSRESTKTPVTS